MANEKEVPSLLYLSRAWDAYSSRIPKPKKERFQTTSFFTRMYELNLTACQAGAVLASLE